MRKRPSIIYSAAVVIGLGCCMVGLVFAVLGLGPFSPISLEIWKLKISTTSVGLAILALGAGFTAWILTNKPPGVALFGGAPPTPRTPISSILLYSIAGIAIVLAILSVGLRP